jgi:phospholipid N-methyltransferase
MSPLLKQRVLTAVLLLNFVSSAHATTLVEVFTIFSRFVKNPTQVGEIAPLSEKAAQELATFVGQTSVDGKKYLEAGGGCGAVSVELAKKLQAADHLDVVEIDAHMCAMLQKRLAPYPNVTVHCCSILDWSAQYAYDGIISTLPFNSLGINFTKQALAHFQELAGHDCVFSYVEYPIVKQAIQYFYVGDRKYNFKAVQEFMEQVRSQFLLTHNIIYFNVPPIAIYHLCFNE